MDDFFGALFFFLSFLVLVGHNKTCGKEMKIIQDTKKKEERSPMLQTNILPL